MMSSCRCATRWHCCAVGHEFHTSRNFNNVTEHCWKQGNCFQLKRIQVSSKTQNVDRVTRTRPEHAPHTASATRRPFSCRPQGRAGQLQTAAVKPAPEKRVGLSASGDSCLPLWGALRPRARERHACTPAKPPPSSLQGRRPRPLPR